MNWRVALAIWLGMVGAPAGLAAQNAPSIIYLDQGWTDGIRQEFYFTPQGSRLMPYDWFLKLERVDADGMFAATSNLERYGFLPADSSSPLNPDSLPIGFAIDPFETQGKGRAVGLTCAACHTANVSVNGKLIRIDGGPGQLDFDTFYADLAAAIHRTLFDHAAFERFAARVLRRSDPVAQEQLRTQLSDFQSAFAGDAAIRRPAVNSGFGRVDALTQILNELSVVDQSEPRNFRAVTAPTRYPQLWLAPELEFVQWDPIAASPIGRNAAEALSAFAPTALTGENGAFDSSLLIPELHQLELWLGDLKPPRWDEEIFGPINRQLAAEGKTLYIRHCQSCHNAPPYERTDPTVNQFGKAFIKIGRADYRDVGTDPTYVEAFVQRLVFTNGTTSSLLDNRSIVPAYDFLISIVSEVIKRAIAKLPLTDSEKLAMTVELHGFRLRSSASPGGRPQPYAPPSLTDLKAGPLAGIWASGPYLHNGSVPTIDELLSPVSQRRSVFWTGGRELDLTRLGYLSDDAPGRFRFDTSLPGNHNTGHVYPNGGLSPNERAALIEFLKTL